MNLFEDLRVANFFYLTCPSEPYSTISPEFINLVTCNLCSYSSHPVIVDHETAILVLPVIGEEQLHSDVFPLNIFEKLSIK